VSAPVPRSSEQLSPFGLLLLAALALGWGLNWPVMKVVLAEVPPLSFRGFCLTLGGLGVLALTRLGGGRVKVPAGCWQPLGWLALTNIAGWNVLAVYGVSLLPSGRAALLGYTMPVWSMLLSARWLGEPLTGRRLAALGLGCAGVALLLAESAAGIAAAPLGAALMLGAAWSWAVGVVLMKRLAVPMPAAALTGWTMLLGGAPMALAAVLLESGQWRMPSVWPALGLAYNVVVAFMFCYWAWNRIVLMVPVQVSSLSSLVTPVIGVVGGMALLGEQPGWQEIAGAGLILGAVAVVTAPLGQGSEGPSGSP